MRKVVTCIDSCFFCDRKLTCSHIGEEGYRCSDFREMPEDPDYSEMERFSTIGGDTFGDDGL